jgi:hypothetical protein
LGILRNAYLLEAEYMDSDDGLGHRFVVVGGRGQVALGKFVAVGQQKEVAAIVVDENGYWPWTFPPHNRHSTDPGMRAQHYWPMVGPKRLKW